MTIKDYLYIMDDTFTLYFRELFIHYSHGESVILNLITKERFANVNNLERNKPLSSYFNLKPIKKSDLIFPHYYNVLWHSIFEIKYNKKLHYREKHAVNYSDGIEQDRMFKWGILKINGDLPINIYQDLFQQKFKIGGGDDIILLDEPITVHQLPL